LAIVTELLQVMLIVIPVIRIVSVRDITIDALMATVTPSRCKATMTTVEVLEIVIVLVATAALYKVTEVVDVITRAKASNLVSAKVTIKLAEIATVVVIPCVAVTIIVEVLEIVMTAEAVMISLAESEDVEAIVMVSVTLSLFVAANTMLGKMLMAVVRDDVAAMLTEQVDDTAMLIDQMARFVADMLLVHVTVNVVVEVFALVIATLPDEAIATLDVADSELVAESEQLATIGIELSI
jgi:hypothetical protein